MTKRNDYIRRLINEAVNEAVSASVIDGLLSILRPMVTSVKNVYDKVSKGDLLDNEVQQFCMYCQRYDEMFRKFTAGRY